MRMLEMRAGRLRGASVDMRAGSVEGKSAVLGSHRRRSVSLLSS